MNYHVKEVLIGHAVNRSNRPAIEDAKITVESDSRLPIVSFGKRLKTINVTPTKERADFVVCIKRQN